MGLLGLTVLAVVCVSYAVAYDPELVCGPKPAEHCSCSLDTREWDCTVSSRRSSRGISRRGLSRRGVDEGDECNPAHLPKYPDGCFCDEDEHVVKCGTEPPQEDNCPEPAPNDSCNCHYGSWLCLPGSRRASRRGRSSRGLSRRGGQVCYPENETGYGDGCWCDGDEEIVKCSPGGPEEVCGPRPGTPYTCGCVSSTGEWKCTQGYRQSEIGYRAGKTTRRTTTRKPTPDPQRCKSPKPCPEAFCKNKKWVGCDLYK